MKWRPRLGQAYLLSLIGILVFLAVQPDAWYVGVIGLMLLAPASWSVWRWQRTRREQRVVTVTRSRLVRDLQQDRGPNDHT